MEEEAEGREDKKFSMTWMKGVKVVIERLDSIDNKYQENVRERAQITQNESGHKQAYTE